MAYTRPIDGDEREGVTEIERDIDKAEQRIIVDRKQLMRNARKRRHKFKPLSPYWQREYEKIFRSWRT